MQDVHNNKEKELFMLIYSFYLQIKMVLTHLSTYIKKEMLGPICSFVIDS